MSRDLGNKLQKNQGQSNKVAPISLDELPLEAREIVNALPKEKQSIAIRFMVQRSHTGPLPLPESFGKYEAVLPGAADRILRMAENQQNHRIDIEKQAVRRQFNQSGTGQWMAFLIALVLIAVGGTLIYYDHDEAGSAIITVTLVGLVIAFIKGKDSQKSNLESKKQ